MSTVMVRAAPAKSGKVAVSPDPLGGTPPVQLAPRLQFPPVALDHEALAARSGICTNAVYRHKERYIDLLLFISGTPEFF